MPIKHFLGAVAVLALLGCDSGPVARAKDAVRQEMLDEDSAQFRDVRVCPHDKEIIGGEVNGKNRYGAYAGYRPFYHYGITVLFSENPGFRDLTRRCYGPEAAAEMDRFMKSLSEPSDSRN